MTNLRASHSGVRAFGAAGRRAARAATGKRKILVASKAYHGSAPWCTPSPAGVTAEDRAHLIHFAYNDVASLEAAADAAGNDLAGVMVSAFKHDIGLDLELPTPAFAQRVRALCTAKGAALMLDEVRAGYRLHAAGSWEPLGVRPDLSAWSKAIANGHALAAVAGTDALRDAATRIFSTGSFWAGGVAMAAALATLTVADRDEGLVATCSASAAASGKALPSRPTRAACACARAGRCRCR